ncbi:MAG: hypothetical protein KDD43_02880 [Bdellovibrionales bacterium]|nr:hypothetical protein [Bdellovibrionales bacterium]
MNWRPNRYPVLLLILLVVAFASFSPIYAQSNSNLETEKGFFQEEDESAIAAEEAGDKELKNSEEEEEEDEDKKEGSGDESDVAEEDDPENQEGDEIAEEDEPPVEEPMDVEDLEGPTYASPPEEEEEPSSRVYSEQRVRPVENLPPSRTQEPKIDPNVTTEQKVPHPFADKGLIRITREKAYLYQTEVSKQDRASSVRFGFFDPIDLASPDTEVAFSDLYPESEMPMLFYDYEWQFWKGFGRLGWKLGTGIYAASGNGAFKSAENAALTPRENFTFIAFPNTIGLIYRLQYWDTQPVVPFVEGGGDVFTFAEIRDDGKSPKFGAAPAAHVAAGASFNLGFLDRSSIIELDREFGINNVWLTAEFRKLIGLSDKFDFSADVINAGFLVEF